MFPVTVAKMNRAAAWSVRGIGRETRDAAQEAARRAGMSLGEWLEEVIADQAADQGVDPDDFDEDQRLDAIGDRLSGSPGRGESRAGRLRRDQSDERPRAPVRPTIQDDSRRAEELLDAAIAKFENRAAKSDARTARAFDSVASLIERNQDDRRDEREALKAVVGRLGSLEERIVKQQTERDALAKQAPVRTDSRADGGVRDLDERMNELSQRLGTLDKSRGAPRSRPTIDMDDAVAQIARRRQELDARTARVAPEPEPSKRGWRNFGVETPTAPRPAEQMRRARDPAGDNTARENAGRELSAAATLQVEIRKLSQRLDELRREQQEKREAPVASIGALRDELAAMSRSLSNLAPRNAVVALEGAIRDLSQRVAASRENGGRDNLLAPVEALVAGLRESLRAHDPRAAVEALQREIGVLGAKVESIANASIDPRAFERIRQQFEETRGLLGALAQRLAPLDRLERKIGELADRVDRLSTSSAPQHESAEVAASLAEARAQLERSTPPSALASIELRLEQIASRMDQALQRPAAAPSFNPGALEELARRIDGVRESIETRYASPPTTPLDASLLEKTMREISAKLDRPMPAAVDPDTFENMIQDLGARIDRRASPVIDTAPLEQVLRKLGERPTALDTTPLEGLMREISAKLDRPSQPAIDSGAFENMIRDLGARIEQRLDASAPREIGALDTGPLEDLMREISAKLDQPARPFVDIRAFEDTIHDLGARIDQRPDAAAFDTRPLEDLMREISAKLDQPGRPFVDIRAFEDTIHDLGARIDQRPDAAAFDIRPLEDLMREISAKLDRPAAPVVDVAAFEDMIRDLAARIDQRPDAAPAIDASALDTGPLEDLMHEISAKLDRPAAPVVDVAAFEGMIRDLGVRIDRRPDPVIDTGPFEDTLNAIHDKIDRGVASDAGALERMVAELLAQLDETRQALSEAPGSSANVGGSDETLARGLADLRAEQSNSDRRIQSSLGGVQDMLERLVDRIGQIEEDVARNGPAPQSASSKPIPAAPYAASSPIAASAALNSMDATIREAPVFAPARSSPEPRADRGVDLPSPQFSATTPMRSIDASEFLIEPGAGAPLRTLENDAIAGANPKGAVNAHIAAARRAAQAALAETAANVAKGTAPSADSAPGVGGIEQAKAFFATRRRPILLGVALVALLTIAFVELGVMRQSNVQKSEIESIDAAKLANVEPAKDADASAASAKIDSRALDTTPVGSINAAPTNRSMARSLTPAPADLVAAIPAAAPQALRAAAGAGDPPAQFELASRLADGRGVARDPHAAFLWFDRAAAQGLAPAQYRLGSFYEKGVGVTRDAALATAWYKKAAEAGNARAMHNLAVLIAEGGGIKPDYSEAANWFQKAAQLGVKDSQYNLAILYARGMGLAQDMNQAWFWFSLAAKQGDQDAAKKRDEVAAKMDAKTLADDAVALASFRAGTPSPAANEVPSPPGGWDAGASGALQAPPASPQATNAAPHTSASSL